ncbi:Centrosomal protein, partial [Armadillidium nasatum]
MSISHKFESLRKQLFISGYREYFSLDSLPLVEHLHDDLKKCQKELDAKIKVLKNLNQRRISELEKESSDKSEKIHQLLELKRRTLPTSEKENCSRSDKEIFIISSPLPPSAMTSHNVCSTCGCESSKKLKSKDTYLTDLLKMTDKKLMIMQGEVETHKQNYSHAQKQIQELERKVHRRETEIERLESLLESCRFVEDNKYMSAHNQLHEQSRKIDHLTKINKELETKLK